ncbi:MAG: transporter substrate-binding domain-containing protein [Oceanospirillaceae bacterium]|nr:transporter substrate-binding domain-containing protein [Oceanospirillaceae bacterium]
MQHFLIYSILALLVFTPSLKAQTLDVAFGQQRPPFVFKADGQWLGIEVDIVKNILGTLGHSIKRELHVSNRRLIVAISKMNFDVAVSVKEKDDSAFYSDIYIEFKNYAISRKADHLVINDVYDLANYDVIAWQNAVQHLGPEYKNIFSSDKLNASRGNYREYTDQVKQNMLFWHGRAEVILVDKYIFLWNKRQLSKQYNTDIELLYHDIFPQTSRYQVAFKQESIRDEFNRVLQHLRETGEYQHIINRYLK